jgi:Aerotolerance regulator N-terminal
MSFVYPFFLFALAAIAVPIIIHLFYFRRFKTVFFTNVKFLQELKEENSSRSRLRNLLVLLMRCLTTAFIVFAFAQPFIPFNSEQTHEGRQAVSVFVDNSYSMAANEADVPLVEKAKQRAREIVAAYASDDEFQVLTADFEGRHQRLVSKDDALKMIDEVKISPASQEVAKVIARQRQTLHNSTSPNKMAFVISDFQAYANANTIAKSTQDTAIAVTLVPLQAIQKKNVAIDSCWLETPVPMLNQTNNMVVKVHNYGINDESNIRLTLTQNGQVKPVGNMNVKAQSTAYDTIPLTIMKTGWHRCEVSITDYPIEFDDHYFLSFKVAQDLKVLSIDENNSTNAYLDAVFRGAPMFKVTHQSSGGVNYSQLKEYNLIILNGLRTVSSGLSSELAAYCKNGGNALVFPSASADINSYNTALSAFGGGNLQSFSTAKRSVADINTNEFVFKDVYLNTNANNLKLPETVGSFALGHGSREEVLLRYRDGGIFVAKYKSDNGNLYLCAAPLDAQYNSLVKSAEVFVPMVYKMGLSRGSSGRIAYTIGKDNTIEIENKSANIDKNTYKICRGVPSWSPPNTQNGTAAGRPQGYAPTDGVGEVIPEQRILGSRAVLTLGTNIRTAGFYDLYLKQDSVQNVFAFNYNRNESNLNYMDEKGMAVLGAKPDNILKANAATNFVEMVGERSRGIVLWKWCIIAALLFLLAETLLIRLWKG